MTHALLKLAAISSLKLLVSTEAAFAGDGKNCDHKDKAKQTTALTTPASATPVMITETVAGQTAVLGATEKMTQTKKTRAVLSFDDAMKLCRDKGAADLQACIDYKTGVTTAYKKSAD